MADHLFLAGDEPSATEHHAAGAENASRGYANMTQEEVEEWVQRCDEAGIQILAHCNGDAATDMLIERTERIVRNEISTWPDGSYEFTDYMDSDGVGGPKVKIHVTLTVNGDELTADFTGSSPQVPRILEGA